MHEASRRLEEQRKFYDRFKKDHQIQELHDSIEA